ncbi:hypothetical protein [Amycolatopsis anabasis]|uniref:hypothetical protein n=1 Tax=Amycolatopsis anabasis TaxID=1840409 RepID=UPI00131AC09B|nr:hypothetical protein [Amycolatopsis anabasis]
MTDSREVEELLAAIDDDPDPLHLDYTPAMWALAELGWPVAPSLLDLMETAGDQTRLRAARALELIVDREHGFVAGRGFPGPEAEDAVRALWARNGDYRYDAEEAARVESVRRWRDWLARRGEPEEET